NHGARRTSTRVIGPEHEVIHQKLRASAKQIRERRVAFVGVEPIRLVDAHPRQRLSLSRELVAAPRKLLLRIQQRQARGQPFLSCSGFVRWHRSSLLWFRSSSTRSLTPPFEIMGVTNV